MLNAAFVGPGRYSVVTSETGDLCMSKCIASRSSNVSHNVLKLRSPSKHQRAHHLIVMKLGLCSAVILRDWDQSRYPVRRSLHPETYSTRFSCQTYSCREFCVIFTCTNEILHGTTISSHDIVSPYTTVTHVARHPECAPPLTIMYNCIRMSDLPFVVLLSTSCLLFYSKLLNDTT
jgi:hypothetical protein